MTLPSSGTLSLNAIHIEAGGSSGTSCSINDSDIRALIGKGSGASMSFHEWYGASAFTADTVIDVTPDISGMKYAVPDFRTYTMTLAANNSVVHNNDITYSSGTTHYAHSCGGSTLTGSGTIAFNNSTSPTAGTGTASYFNGKYWRIPSTYNDGTSINNSGNHLVSGGTSNSFQDTLASGSPTVFSGFTANIATGQPCGQFASKRLQINIY